MAEPSNKHNTVNSITLEPVKKMNDTNMICRFYNSMSNFQNFTAECKMSNIGKHIYVILFSKRILKTYPPAVTKHRKNSEWPYRNDPKFWDR